MAIRKSKSHAGKYCKCSHARSRHRQKTVAGFDDDPKQCMVCNCQCYEDNGLGNGCYDTEAFSNYQRLRICSNGTRIS